MIGRLNALHENERAKALGRLVASLDRKRPGARQPRRRREPRAEAFSIRRLEGSRWRLRRRGSVPSGAVRSPVTAFIYLKIKSFPIAAETACSIMGSGDMSSHKPDRPSGRDAAPALSKNTKRTQSHFPPLPRFAIPLRQTNCESVSAMDRSARGVGLRRRPWVGQAAQERRESLQ